MTSTRISEPGWTVGIFSRFPPLTTTPNRSTCKMVSRIEEALSKKDLQILKTPLCGYRTFSNLLDATAWEHLHPTMPVDVCEPQKLRATLYAAASRSL